MKQTITLYKFREEFNNMRPDSFSYEGLEALFNYLVDMEEDTGVELELDVIQLCGDFSEYQDLEEFNKDNNTDYNSLEELEEEEGSIIKIDDEAFIVSNN